MGRLAATLWHCAPGSQNTGTKVRRSILMGTSINSHGHNPTHLWNIKYPLRRMDWSKDPSPCSCLSNRFTIKVGAVVGSVVQGSNSISRTISISSPLSVECMLLHFVARILLSRTVMTGAWLCAMRPILTMTSPSLSRSWSPSTLTPD